MEASSGDLNRLINSIADEGITCFDHADIYGDYSCERLFGEAAELSPGLRDRIQLVTKCGIRLVSKHQPGNKLKYYDTGRDHIISSVENSLKNLKTDFIDLLLIHRPDPFMNPNETAEAFPRSKPRKGETLRCVKFSAAAVQYAQLLSGLPLVTNQLEISPLNLEHFGSGTIDQCLEKRIHPMAWSPLGGGALFNSDQEDMVRLRVVLKGIMKETGAESIDQIVYAWLMSHPAGIIPVIGTGSLSRIKSAAASADIRLERQQWFRILQAASGEEVP